MLKKYSELVNLKAKPADAILTDLKADAVKCDLLHAALGMTLEMLELQFAVEDKDKENVIEEAGDLWFYVQLVINRVDSNIFPEAEEPKILETTPEQALSALGGAVFILAEKLKKIALYDKVYANPVGDVILAALTIYYLLQAFLHVHGSSLAAALEANHKKLDVRYKGGYSDKEADSRADKA